MFKNLIFYRIIGDWLPTLAAAEQSISAARFVECGASQEQSLGWTEPRGDDHGPLIESVAGQWIMKFAVETKVLPGSVLKQELSNRLQKIEGETGRKPGKKETRDIKDDVRLSLLPQAFTKKSHTLVWIDPSRKMLVLDATSNSKADACITAIIKSFEHAAVQLVHTQTSPAAAMSLWLSNKETPSSHFSTDRDCILRACDESKASVRYAKHALDIDEVRGHIQSGKVPTMLAMTWRDRVSFNLCDTGNLKRVTFLDTATQDAGADSKSAANEFDADIAITTGALSSLIPDLIDVLGGEVKS